MVTDLYIKEMYSCWHICLHYQGLGRALGCIHLTVLSTAGKPDDDGSNCPASINTQRKAVCSFPHGGVRIISSQWVPRRVGRL